MDHLSRKCRINQGNSRCYFHELAEHINVCRHMILKGDHIATGCRVCDKNGFVYCFCYEIEQLCNIVRITNMHLPVL